MIECNRKEVLPAYGAGLAVMIFLATLLVTL